MGQENLLQNSSIPGVGILVNKNTPRFRKRVWIFVITAGAMAFILHMIVLITRLASFPVIIQVAYREHPFEFPDITICHTGPYSMRRTKHSEEKLLIDETIDGLVMRTGKELIAGVKNFWKALLPEFRHLDFNEYTRDDNVISRDSIYPYGLKLGLGHEPQESIIGCQFKGKPCSFLNFTVIQLPEYLNCFTFKPSFDADRTSLVPGEEEGLSLIIMDADRKKLMTEMETLDFIRGVKVFIHRKGTYPFKEFFEIAQVGKLTKIGLQATRSYRVDSLADACSANSGQIQYCASEANVKLNKCKTFGYTMELCRDLAAQDQVIQNCKCVSEELPVSPKHVKFPFCHMVNSSFISSNYKRNHSNSSIYLINRSVHLAQVPEVLKDAYDKYRCHRRTLKDIKSRLTTSNYQCNVPCYTETHSTYTSIFDWPTHAKYAKKPLRAHGNATYQLAKQMNLDTYHLRNKIFNGTLDKTVWVKARFLRLFIYPKTGYSVRMDETLAYPWSAFLSDVGGILGLWIGFSMITIVEVIEWVILRLKKHCAACRKKQDKESSVNGKDPGFADQEAKFIPVATL